MPVINAILSKNIIDRIRRTVNRHMRDGRIPVPETNPEFNWALHCFELIQVSEIGWKPAGPVYPDGYLVLIGKEGEVRVGVEILQQGSQLHFSHSVQGAHLDELVAALNAASLRYADEPQPVSLSIAGHFLTGNIIIAARVNGLTSCYRFAAEELMPVSDDKLVAELDALNASRVV